MASATCVAGLADSTPATTARERNGRRPTPAPLLILAAGLALCVLSPGPALAQNNGPMTPVMIGLILPPTNGADPLQAAVARSMHEGAVMANEELGQNAKLLGMPFTVVTKTAADSTAAVTAAKQLIAQGAVTLVAGLEDTETEAVARVADQAKVPLLNVLAETDNLRNQACSSYLFDIAPSAAMYLDALEGWFLGQGLRNWVFVVSDDTVGDSMLARARTTLTRKHFAARVAGVVRVKPGAPVDAATLQEIKKDSPDVVVLLLSANDQLAFVKAYAKAGMKALITGFPYPDAQTRTFFKAWHEAAGSAEAGYRSEAWDAKLPSFGAVQLNSRFEKRWNQPMDTASWGAFMAFQVLYNTLTSGGARTRAAIQTYFEQPNTVFDVWKGVGVSFRPWNHQLRQVLYLVHIEKNGSVSLVGTLPEVFKPGTSLLERLDQIGYSKSASRCHL